MIFHGHRLPSRRPLIPRSARIWPIRPSSPRFVARQSANLKWVVYVNVPSAVRRVLKYLMRATHTASPSQTIASPTSPTPDVSFRWRVRRSRLREIMTITVDEFIRRSFTSLPSGFHRILSRPLLANSCRAA
ncbi:MAG: transposase [Blastocatellia bacterium]|nr:transposase [Blastocatellia bacterium]